MIDREMAWEIMQEETAILIILHCIQKAYRQKKIYVFDKSLVGILRKKKFENVLAFAY